MSNLQVRRDFIIGTRRLENYFWAILLFLGGGGFIFKGLTGLTNIDSGIITQEAVMVFYGYISISICAYLACSIFWNVGAGYNEFNKQAQEVKLVRWGFPGKFRRVVISVPFKELQEVSIQSQNFGIQPSTIYLNCQNGQKLPILQTNLTVRQLESYATQIAYFLQLPLKDISL